MAPLYIDVKKFHVSFEIELSLGTSSTCIKIVCNMLYYYVIVLASTSFKS